MAWAAKPETSKKAIQTKYNILKVSQK